MKIVVIGSVHLDVRAQTVSDASYDAVQDAAGVVRYAIGGCAYNVAWNLVANTRLLDDRVAPDVVLLTAVAAETLDGHSVLAKARSIGFRVVQLGRVSKSSGYVAHLTRSSGAPTRKAITGCAVEDLVPEERHLSPHIVGASMVYVDSNVNVHTLTVIVRVCAREKKRLLIAVASDDKAARVRDALALVSRDERSGCIVSMNAREAEVLGCIDRGSPECIAQLADELGVSTLIVTRGMEGWMLWHGNSCRHVPAPAAPDPVLPSGAGDALCAAVCLMLAEFKDEAFSQRTLQAVVDRTVTPILAEVTATPGATEFDLARGVLDPNGPLVPMVLLLGILALVACGVGMVEGLSHALQLFVYMLVCAASGSLGALMRPIWRRLSPDGVRTADSIRIDWSQVALSSVVAFIAVAIMIGLQVVWLPGATVESVFKTLSTDPTRPYMVGCALGFLTGFGSHQFLSWVSRRVIE